MAQITIGGNCETLSVRDSHSESRNCEAVYVALVQNHLNSRSQCDTVISVCIILVQAKKPRPWFGQDVLSQRISVKNEKSAEKDLLMMIKNAVAC